MEGGEEEENCKMEKDREEEEDMEDKENDREEEENKEEDDYRCRMRRGTGRRR